ncbi:hypothetical protein [Streptomyces sp. B1I3]|uniref:hypothetical protein n=1 Tax=Streptomyces sp. B1I3 TaxID=3042264 RepID=UPI0027D8B531|nr:hypothetical protein [Streptomyces sp. B1I3]
MTRTSGRTDRRRGGSALPASLGWVLVLVAVVFCCSPAAASAHHTDASPASAARTFTPVLAAPVSVVTADAPGERGIGSSCHGATNHSTPVVLPGPTAPVALPCPSAVAPPGPLTGGEAIRGPSDDGVGAVDHLRLQVQRI